MVCLLVLAVSRVVAVLWFSGNATILRFLDGRCIPLALESWFFFGSAVVCLVIGYQHWRYAVKQLSLPKMAQKETQV